MASVAKSRNGIEKAFAHFPEVAKKHSMPVLMTNSIGFCDTFKSAGQSAIWDRKGNLIGQLDSKSEGVLIFDTKTGTVVEKKLAVNKS